MKHLLFIVLTVLAFVACEKPIYTGPCDQEILKVNSTGDLFDSTTSINDISWNGECLDISFSYSGGCSEHLIEVITDGMLTRTDPPILDLSIKHENNDSCEAWITESISYDIGMIDALNDEDEVILNFTNPEFTYTLEK